MFQPASFLGTHLNSPGTQRSRGADGSGRLADHSTAMSDLPYSLGKLEVANH